MVWAFHFADCLGLACVVFGFICGDCVGKDLVVWASGLARVYSVGAHPKLTHAKID